MRNSILIYAIIFGAILVGANILTGWPSPTSIAGAMAVGVFLAYLTKNGK